MNPSTAASLGTCSLTGNRSISPYLCRNLPTRARYLLARPITSSTGSSCRRLIGKLSAIQHRPLSFLGWRGFLALPSFWVAGTGSQAQLTWVQEPREDSRLWLLFNKHGGAGRS